MYYLAFSAKVMDLLALLNSCGNFGLYCCMSSQVKE